MSSSNKNVAVVLMHVAVWLGLLLVPLFLLFENQNFAWRFPWRVLVMLFSIMVVFYSNLLWAIDKLLYRQRVFYFILFNLALFFFVDELGDFLSHCFDETSGHRPPKPDQAMGLRALWILNNTVFHVLVVGASIGLRHSTMLHHVEVEKKKLENETLTSELAMLRYQVQPHFFFNTLNNIYALIGRSPSDAQKAVLSLSKMMRYVLYDSQPHNISVNQEIDFLHNYIRLMRLRLRPEAEVVLDVPEVPTGVFVPSLVLIPLLENAFKHGMGQSGEASIRCELSFPSPGQLYFSVSNSIYEVAYDDRSTSGIGLENLRKRLEIIYGQDNFSLEVGSVSPNEYVARLQMPTFSSADEKININ